MVDNIGQLYTIEGVAAAILMIFTTYLVLTTTTIMTPADTHVIDMQLEQLGNDALAMMDVIDPGDTSSPLENYVMDWISGGNLDEFKEMFDDYVNSNFEGKDIRPISFNAYIIYRNNTSGDVIKENFKSGFLEPHRSRSARPVSVTRWVHLTKPPLTKPPLPDFDSRPQSVLLEVILWRD